MKEALVAAGVSADVQALKALFYEVDVANHGYVTSRQIANAVGIPVEVGSRAYIVSDVLMRLNFVFLCHTLSIGEKTQEIEKIP